MKRLIVLFSLIVFCQPAYADMFMSADEAIKKIFKGSTAFNSRKVFLEPDDAKLIEEKAKITFGQMHSAHFVFYEVKNGETVVGVAFEDTVFGKWGPIRFLVGLTLDGKVADTYVLESQEIRGKNIKKKRFLKQYRGKSTKNSVRLRRDINGISGATISSTAMTDGVRKFLYIYQELKDKLNNRLEK